MGTRVIAVVCVVLATSACGRLGFDAGDGAGRDGDIVPPPPDAANGFGCGLRDLAVGSNHSCVITGAGALWCWGREISTTPSQIALEGPAAKVVLGHSHVCALLTTGKLRCFGQNGTGALGDGGSGFVDPDSPVAPVGDKTYIDVAGLRAGVCAVTAEGGLECWGDDTSGVLGNGSDTSDHREPMAVTVSGVTNFRRVFASRNGVCADTADDRRFCWGFAPLVSVDFDQEVPVEVNETGPIGLGSLTTCRLVNGDVSCLGIGSGGELGDGRIAVSESDWTAPILSGAVAVAGGHRAQCAIGAEGELWCWGGNRSGNVGTGDVSYRATPTRIAIPKTARVALAFAHTCAETEDGVYCWGGNVDGQLGRGTTSIELERTPIDGLPANIAEVRVSSRSGIGCARTAGGEVWCWGQGYYGATGIADLTSSPTATRITLPFAAAEIVVGGEYACARNASQVACWGRGDFDALGSAAPSSTPTPRLVPGLPAAAVLTSLVANDASGTCVLADGQPYCWGSFFGKTGDGPQQVTGLPALASLTGPRHESNTHACALDTGGTAWCWGSNQYGELGRGTIGTSSSTPAQVVGGRTYSQIAIRVGYEARTCAILVGGAAEIDCWGHYNTTASTSVTTIPMNGVPVRIEAGDQSMCVVLADGTRECSGDGYNGQWGNGMRVYAGTFMHVTNTASQLSVSGTNACFVDGGVVTCTGETRHGGLGAAPASAAPQRVDLACE